MQEHSAEQLTKEVYILCLEISKIMGMNSNELEKIIISKLKDNKVINSKATLFWLLRRAMTNNCFELARYLIRRLQEMTTVEQVQIWVNTLQFLTELPVEFQDTSKNSYLGYMSTILILLNQCVEMLNKIKTCINENTFTYQYLKNVYFLVSGNSLWTFRIE